MIAMDVLAIVRCLSCCSVSDKAERPWLISAGRSATHHESATTHTDPPL